MTARQRSASIICPFWVVLATVAVLRGSTWITVVEAVGAVKIPHYVPPRMYVRSTVVIDMLWEMFTVG